MRLDADSDLSASMRLELRGASREMVRFTIFGSLK